MGEEAYDVSLLVSPANPELEVTCGVCLDLLRDPKLTACCGHHFCGPCLEQVQASTGLCPLCKEPKVTGMLNKALQRKIAALAVNCPHKSRGCSWTGELRGLAGHLARTEREGECQYVEVPCRNCQAPIERQRLQDHEGIECLIRPGASADDGMINLNRRVQCLENENAALRAKIEQLEQHQSANTCLIAKLREEVDTLKRVTMPTSITGISSSIYPNDSQISIPNRVIPYQFTFAEYSRRSAHPEAWFSEPFYTRPGGYKFTIRVAPEGLGQGRGTHVSVHAYLMRGEHDDRLQWPLRGIIMLELLNQLGDNCHFQQMSEFTDRTPSQYCSRVTDAERAEHGWGKSQFISKVELERGCGGTVQYLRDDCLKFRISSFQPPDNSN